jgi:exodeoxyribonuclease-5
MLAREGKFIRKGRYGRRTLVTGRGDISDRMLMTSDINICGRNSTRASLNAHIRDLYDRHSELPVVGDKLICRRNNWEIEVTDIFGSIRNEKMVGVNLINGLIGECTAADREKRNYTDEVFKMDFRPEFMRDGLFEDLTCDMSCFIKTGDKKKDDANFRWHRGEKFEFGYAITCHLSQGSSWNKVVVYSEYLGDKEFQKRWLYTAITRSEDLLILGM